MRLLATLVLLVASLVATSLVSAELLQVNSLNPSTPWIWPASSSSSTTAPAEDTILPGSTISTLRIGYDDATTSSSTATPASPLSLPSNAQLTVRGALIGVVELAASLMSKNVLIFDSCTIGRVIALPLSVNNNNDDIALDDGSSITFTRCNFSAHALNATGHSFSMPMPGSAISQRISSWTVGIHIAKAVVMLVGASLSVTDNTVVAPASSAFSFLDISIINAAELLNVSGNSVDVTLPRARLYYPTPPYDDRHFRLSDGVEAFYAIALTRVFMFPEAGGQYNSIPPQPLSPNAVEKSAITTGIFLCNNSVNMTVSTTPWITTGPDNTHLFGNGTGQRVLDLFVGVYYNNSFAIRNTPQVRFDGNSLLLDSTAQQQPTAEHGLFFKTKLVEVAAVMLETPRTYTMLHPPNHLQWPNQPKFDNQCTTMRHIGLFSMCGNTLRYTARFFSACSSSSADLGLLAVSQPWLIVGSVRVAHFRNNCVRCLVDVAHVVFNHNFADFGALNITGDATCVKAFIWGCSQFVRRLDLSYNRFSAARYGGVAATVDLYPGSITAISDGIYVNWNYGNLTDSGAPDNSVAPTEPVRTNVAYLIRVYAGFDGDSIAACDGDGITLFADVKVVGWAPFDTNSYWGFDNTSHPTQIAPGSLQSFLFQRVRMFEATDNVADAVYGHDSAEGLEFDVKRSLYLGWVTVQRNRVSVKTFWREHRRFTTSVTKNVELGGTRRAIGVSVRFVIEYCHLILITDNGITVWARVVDEFIGIEDADTFANKGLNASRILRNHVSLSGAMQLTASERVHGIARQRITGQHNAGIVEIADNVIGITAEKCGAGGCDGINFQFAAEHELRTGVLIMRNQISVLTRTAGPITGVVVSCFDSREPITPLGSYDFETAPMDVRLALFRGHFPVKFRPVANWQKVPRVVIQGNTINLTSLVTAESDGGFTGAVRFGVGGWFRYPLKEGAYFETALAESIARSGISIEIVNNRVEVYTAQFSVMNSFVHIGQFTGVVRHQEFDLPAPYGTMDLPRLYLYCEHADWFIRALILDSNIVVLRGGVPSLISIDATTMFVSETITLRKNNIDLQVSSSVPFGSLFEPMWAEPAAGFVSGIFMVTKAIGFKLGTNLTIAGNVTVIDCVFNFSTTVAAPGGMVNGLWLDSVDSVAGGVWISSTFLNVSAARNAAASAVALSLPSMNVMGDRLVYGPRVKTVSASATTGAALFALQSGAAMSSLNLNSVTAVLSVPALASAAVAAIDASYASLSSSAFSANNSQLVLNFFAGNDAAAAAAEVPAIVAINTAIASNFQGTQRQAFSVQLSNCAINVTGVTDSSFRYDSQVFSLVNISELALTSASSRPRLTHIDLFNTNFSVGIGRPASRFRVINDPVRRFAASDQKTAIYNEKDRIQVDSFCARLDGKGELRRNAIFFSSVAAFGVRNVISLKAFCGNTDTHSHTVTHSHLPPCAPYQFQQVSPALSVLDVRGRSVRLLFALVLQSESDDALAKQQRQLLVSQVNVPPTPPPLGMTGREGVTVLRFGANFTNTTMESLDPDVAFAAHASVTDWRALYLTLQVSSNLYHRDDFEARVVLPEAVMSCRVVAADTSDAGDKQKQQSMVREMNQITVKLKSSYSFLPADVRRTMNTVASSSAFVSALIATSPVSLAKLNTAKALAQFVYCDFNDVEEIDASQAPLRIPPFGPLQGSFQRAALVGNILVMIIVVGAIAGVAVLAWWNACKEQAAAAAQQEGQHQQQEQKRPPPALLPFIYDHKLPSALVIPMGALLQGTLSTAVALLRHRAAGSSDIVLGTVGVGIHLLFYLWTVWNIVVVLPRLMSRKVVNYKTERELQQQQRTDQRDRAAGVGVDNDDADNTNKSSNKQSAAARFPSCEFCLAQSPERAASFRGRGRSNAAAAVEATPPQGKHERHRENHRGEQRDLVHRLNPKQWWPYRVVKHFLTPHGEWLFQQPAPKRVSSTTRTRSPSSSSSSALETRRFNLLPRLQTEQEAAEESRSSGDATFLGRTDKILDDAVPKHKGQYLTLVDLGVGGLTAIATGAMQADPGAAQCSFASAALSVINALPLVFYLVTDPFRKRSAELFGFATSAAIVGLSTATALARAVNSEAVIDVFDVLNFSLGTFISIKLVFDFLELVFLFELEDIVGFLQYVPIFLRHHTLHRWWSWTGRRAVESNNRRSRRNEEAFQGRELSEILLSGERSESTSNSSDVVFLGPGRGRRRNRHLAPKCWSESVVQGVVS